MFKVMPTGSTIDVDPKQIVALQQSINQQPIAVAGPMRPAKASIVSLYSRSGNYRVYVFLGLVEDRGPAGEVIGTLFRCDPPEVTLADYERYEAEALEMVETQGFTMERVDFHGAAPQEQHEVLSTLPFLGRTAPPPPPVRRDLPVGGLPKAGPSASSPGRPTIGSGLIAMPVEISREITLPARETVKTLSKLLSLF